MATVSSRVYEPCRAHFPPPPTDTRVSRRLSQIEPENTSIIFMCDELFLRAD